MRCRSPPAISRKIMPPSREVQSGPESGRSRRRDKLAAGGRAAQATDQGKAPQCEAGVVGIARAAAAGEAAVVALGGRQPLAVAQPQILGQARRPAGQSQHQLGVVGHNPGPNLQIPNPWPRRLRRGQGLGIGKLGLGLCPTTKLMLRLAGGRAHHCRRICGCTTANGWRPPPWTDGGFAGRRSRRAIPTTPASRWGLALVGQLGACPRAPRRQPTPFRGPLQFPAERPSGSFIEMAGGDWQRRRARTSSSRCGGPTAAMRRPLAAGKAAPTRPFSRQCAGKWPACRGKTPKQPHGPDSPSPQSRRRFEHEMHGKQGRPPRWPF